MSVLINLTKTKLPEFESKALNFKVSSSIEKSLQNMIFVECMNIYIYFFFKFIYLLINLFIYYIIRTNFTPQNLSSKFDVLGLNTGVHTKVKFFFSVE